MVKPEGRRLPVGAEPSPHGTQFRVWAPKHRHLAVVLEDEYGEHAHELTREDDGWFSSTVTAASAGMHYRFRADDGRALPDPASRYQALALRFSDDAGSDRLLIVNLGADLQPRVVPEPLLAPPDGVRWQLLLSTEDMRYGGRGALHPELDDGWFIPARSAAVLAPGRSPEDESNV